MLPNRGGKRSNKTYRIRNKLLSQIDQEYEAEKAMIPIVIESDSEDELVNRNSVTSNDTLLTGLKMSCSDDEEQFAAGGGSAAHTNHVRPHPAATEMANLLRSRSNYSPTEATVDSVSNMFSQLSKQITSMLEETIKIDQKSDRIRQEISNMSDRLGRVEKKAGITLTTLQQVNRALRQDNQTEEPNTRTQQEPETLIKLISSEQELEEFDAKLGADEEFYSKVKQWLTKNIDGEPLNRMHTALDLVFELNFFAQCGWKGYSKNGPKVCFHTRENILKLFGDIGSSDATTVLPESFVNGYLKKKLVHAGRRARGLKGLRKSVPHKRRHKPPQNVISLKTPGKMKP